MIYQGLDKLYVDSSYIGVLSLLDHGNELPQEIDSFMLIRVTTGGGGEGRGRANHVDGRWERALGAVGEDPAIAIGN